MRTQIWKNAPYILLFIALVGCVASKEVVSNRTLQKRKYTGGWFLNHGHKSKSTSTQLKAQVVTRRLTKKDNSESDKIALDVVDSLANSSLLIEFIESTQTTESKQGSRPINDLKQKESKTKSVQKQQKVEETSNNSPISEIEARHNDYSFWTPLVYFLLVLVYPVVLRNKFQKKIAAWARDNKRTSLILLLIAQVLMLGISYILGLLLGFTVSPWLAALGLVLFVLALLLNQQSERLGIMGFKSRMSGSITLSLGSGFTAFTLGSNGVFSNWDTFSNWSLLDGFLRVSADPSNEMSDSHYTGIIILLTIALFILLVGIAIMTCMLSCQGNDIGALVLGFGGTLLVLLLFIWLYIHNNRKFDLQLEREGRDAKIRKKLFRNTLSITLITMLLMTFITSLLLDL